MGFQPNLLTNTDNEARKNTWTIQQLRLEKIGTDFANWGWSKKEKKAIEPNTNTMKIESDFWIILLHSLDIFVAYL